MKTDIISVIVQADILLLKKTIRNLSVDEIHERYHVNHAIIVKL